MKLLKILNPENASEAEMSKFDVRQAVRGIVYDANGNIAVLHVTRLSYHKLPGGGSENGEDPHATLKRECLEELGCNIEITGEVGQITEYRKMFQIKQLSPCYTAQVVGEKGRPSFTKEEIDNGFKILWVPIEQALHLLRSDHPSHEAGLYIVPREIVFLETVINELL